MSAAIRFDTRKSFGKQEVNLLEILPSPEGYESLFLGIYFLLIPYVAGLIFLFVFVAQGHFESFLGMNIGLFMAVWAIGYECVASLALIAIFYKMFQFNRLRKGASDSQRRPLPSENVYQVYRFT